MCLTWTKLWEKNKSSYFKVTYTKLSLVTRCIPACLSRDCCPAMYQTFKITFIPFSICNLIKLNFFGWLFNRISTKTSLLAWASCTQRVMWERCRSGHNWGNFTACKSPQVIRLEPTNYFRELRCCNLAEAHPVLCFHYSNLLPVTHWDRAAFAQIIFLLFFLCWNSVVKAFKSLWGKYEIRAQM